MMTGKDNDDDFEAGTISGMVQQAMFVAFIRASKVELGVSAHAGTRYCYSRASRRFIECSLSHWNLRPRTWYPIRS